jgi:hypothetical protein
MLESKMFRHQHFDSQSLHLASTIPKQYFSLDIGWLNSTSMIDKQNTFWDALEYVLICLAVLRHHIPFLVTLDQHHCVTRQARIRHISDFYGPRKHMINHKFT